MEMSSSLRKRADAVFTVDALSEQELVPPTPERHAVQEAELEHVAPLRNNKNSAEQISDQSRMVTSDFFSKREMIVQKLGTISAYENQITDLITRIDQERSGIDQLVQHLTD